MTMKEQIVNTLRNHPCGLRLRAIAMYLRINQFSIINDMDELLKAGLVTAEQNDDHANGEYYLIWKAV